MAKEVKDYTGVIKYLNKSKRRKHLLLGNGFSMSYDKSIFSYKGSKFSFTVILLTVWYMVAGQKIKKL